MSIALMTLIGAGTSLWWMRLLMFALGFAMGQVGSLTGSRGKAT
jgi:hypothetical protein